MFAVNFKRLANSAVVWSWITNALRAGSGLIVVPLLFRKLSPSDLGMSGVLLSLSVLGAMFDFGFAPTVDRFISYAMGGVKTLEPHGVPEKTGEHAPNFALLWDLLLTTRRLYRHLALILLVVLGGGGTIMVENVIRAEHVIHPEFTLLMPRLAWGITLVSVILDIYSNWWGIYLRGLNEVRSAAQVAGIASMAKLVISAGLLLGNAGLLSIPIATIVASYIQRRYARHRCLQLLPPQPPAQADSRKIFAAMWPNSWRMGLQLASSYLVAQANTLLCAHFFHLEITGMYSYSVQLMGYAITMASVWTSTKWPVIGQYQARRDYAKIRRVLRPRIWLQALTFLTLALGVVFVAPLFLRWIGHGKQLLAIPWMLTLMASCFMELQIGMFGTLIATGNSVPYLRAGLLTSLLSLLTSLALLRWTSLGVGSLLLGPIICGVFFNYWYWPQFAAKGLKTNLAGLLFSPDTERTAPAQAG